MVLSSSQLRRGVMNSRVEIVTGKGDGDGVLSGGTPLANL